MRAARAQQTHFVAHTHTIHDALRRGDRLACVGAAEFPQFLPCDRKDSMRQRRYLRVPLTDASTPGTVWLVQLTHIKSGGKRGPSFLGSNPLNKKIQLSAAAQLQGREAAAKLAAGASTPSVVVVTMGDQNLQEREVLDNKLRQSLVQHAFFLTASEGVVDQQGRRHQDLVMVDRVPGVTLEPIPCDVKGFDQVHQAIRARVCREPTGRPRLALEELADAAAASTRGTPAHDPAPMSTGEGQEGPGQEGSGPEARG